MTAFKKRNLPMPHMDKRCDRPLATIRLSEIALTPSERINADLHLKRADLDLMPRDLIETMMIKMSSEERAAFVAGAAVGRSI